MTSIPVQSLRPLYWINVFSLGNIFAIKDKAIERLPINLQHLSEFHDKMPLCGQLAACFHTEYVALMLDQERDVASSRTTSWMDCRLRGQGRYASTRPETEQVLTSGRVNERIN